MFLNCCFRGWYRGGAGARLAIMVVVCATIHPIETSRRDEEEEEVVDSVPPRSLRGSRASPPATPRGNQSRPLFGYVSG